MPEYVYALHDFVPENEDEVPFKAGDRIEVLEKDEEFQDGWWQVCYRSMTCFVFLLRRVAWCGPVSESQKLQQLQQLFCLFLLRLRSFVTFAEAFRYPGSQLGRRNWSVPAELHSTSTACIFFEHTTAVRNAQ